MSGCAGTSFTNIIYTKLSTFPSREISGLCIGQAFLARLCRYDINGIIEYARTAFAKIAMAFQAKRNGKLPNHMCFI